MGWFDEQLGRMPPSYNGNEGSDEPPPWEVPPVGPPPVAPPGPTGPPQPGGPNKYGNQVNLDPAHIESQVRAAFQKKGVPNPSPQDVAYWVGKASQPDIYSDNVVRIGWNPYWEDKLMTGSGSSDPRLAGNEGAITDPGKYGIHLPILGGPGYRGPGQFTDGMFPGEAQAQSAPPMSTLPPTPGSWSETTGGGGTGGGGGGGGWTMPKGSDYQFAGVPGYSGGGQYQAGAFGSPARGGATPGLPEPSGMSVPGQGGGIPSSSRMEQDPPTGQFGSGQLQSAAPIPGQGGGLQTGGKDLPGAFGAQSVRSSLPPEQAGGRMAPESEGQGQFGAGLMPSNVQIPGGAGGRNMMETGNKTTPTQGAPPPNYNRAPSFTPIDPFKAPPVPDAYPEWKPTQAEKFVLPTGQEALNQDPGYQFRLEQGTKALQSSAAAKGLLRTGGTLKDIEAFGQQAGSQEYQNAVNRAMATAGFNQNANSQNNAFGLQGAQFNAGQRDLNYQNKYTAANQGYAYANQQNLAGNNQAMEGYKTDVSRELGRMGIDLSREQSSAINALNGQQQQWMQLYMQNGQSFDQAYKMMMAQLQYPS